MGKRLAFKITDIETLQKAFPEVITEKTVVQKIVDKELLYKIVKLNSSLGREVPGVEIGSGSEEETGGENSSAPASEPASEPAPEPKPEMAKDETPHFLNKKAK